MRRGRCVAFSSRNWMILTGRIRRHEQAQPLAQPVAVVFENRIACAVPHQVGRSRSRTAAA